MLGKELLLGQSKFSAKAVSALLILIVASALGNHFTLRLFPGVEILFGSIAVLLVMRVFGTAWGVVASIVSVLPVMSTGYPPFGLALYVGEALAVGLAYRRTDRDIALLDGYYWLFIGMPATWFLSVYFGEHGDAYTVLYFMARNGVNGVANALAVSLILQLPVLLGQSHPGEKKTPLRRVILSLLVSSALAPALLLTVTSIRQQQGVVETMVLRELENTATHLLIELAGRADRQEGALTPFGLTQIANELRRHDHNGETPVTLLDRSGRVIASSRDDLASGQAYMHDGNIDLRALPTPEGRSRIGRDGSVGAMYWNAPYYELEIPLHGSSGGVLLVETRTEPYRVMLREFLAAALWLMLGLAALAFLLGRMFSGRLSNPLAQLAEASTNLKWKVLEEERIPLPASPIIEINTLVANFGDMAIGFGKIFHEFLQYHEELEQGINERTHALHEINLQLEVEIAEHKQSEEKLAERALVLEKTMGELEAQKFALDQHSIVAITDSHGKIIYANDKFCEISQYSREELLGQDHRILNSGYHPHEFFMQMWAAIARGEVWRGEVRNRKKDGSFYWVETTIVPFLDAMRKPYQYVVIRTDITASKQAGQELLRAKEEAERANRAKSEFLSRMSHELRTPLNAILGFAQLMEYDPDEPLSPTQSASVKHIIQAGWHQLELVNEVLDLARIESGRMQLHLEKVMLAPAVRECIDLVSPLSIERQLKIEDLVATCGECFVWADPTRFKQVLLNLLSNAIKYNREGGTITVVCQRSAPGRRKVSVTDTGPGIPADKLDELFVPFNRLDADKSQTQGTGVGLAVTKRLVELMGGEIGVESRPGEGAIFWFDLPEHGSDDGVVGKAAGLMS